MVFAEARARAAEGIVTIVATRRSSSALGNALLIVVSVALDMVQRIEANLLMRNYGGFLSGPGQKGKRIKGRQY